jgi:hypothetical protein
MPPPSRPTARQTDAAALTDAVVAQIAPSHHHAPRDTTPRRRRRAGTSDRVLLGLVAELSRTGRARNALH